MPKQKKLRGNVLGALCAHGGEASLFQIAEATKLTPRSTKDMLKHLEKHGHVVCVDRHSHNSRWAIPSNKDHDHKSKKR